MLDSSSCLDQRLQAFVNVFLQKEIHMKKCLIALVLAVFVLLPISTASSAPAANVTIELLNPPPDGLLELEVGEAYTFDIQITSDDPFILAIALTDAYYPGRGVSWHGNDIAHHATSATLHLTMKSKNSTAGLAAVCDWPEPGTCWPEGVAPVSIVVGVRYKGGLVIVERFDFAAVVP